ncbi:hypothetical protein [Pyxidicoccus trucidator]|uniref:hypothetical protein n=1 Tax=Pyxidicoccus trucidator TaxID=2709662 RepID=UPI0013DB5EFA|nr:hypothetical protein [Pyxidicoccus trucidator]
MRAAAFVAPFPVGLVWVYSAWAALIVSSFFTRALHAYGLLERWPVRAVLALGVIPLLCFYAALPPLRMLLRAFPVRIDGRPRRGCIAAAGLGFLYFALFYGGLASGYVLQGDVLGVGFIPLLGMAGTGLLSMLLFLGLHVRPAFLRERPSVVFLRRFSSFADRVVLGSVLRSVPPGIPVVALTPPASQASDWDPVLLGLSGLKLRSPLASLPCFLSGDAQWKAQVEELVSRARVVLIDVSDVSPAIDDELGIIIRQKALSKTLFIQEAGSESAGLDRDMPGLQDALGGARILTYERSLRAALPKVVLSASFLLTVMAFTLFLPEAAAFLSGGMRAWMNPAAEVSLSSPALAQVGWSSWEHRLAAIGGGLLWLVPLLYTLPIFRRALTRQVRRELEEAIHRLLAQSRAA